MLSSSKGLIYKKIFTFFFLVISILMTQAVEDCVDALLSKIRQILDEDRIADTKHGLHAIVPDGPLLLVGQAPSSPSTLLGQKDQPEGLHVINNRYSRILVPLWEQQAPLNTMTLPDIVDMLASEDMNCIVCVRRIHRLGFKSVRHLRRFFSVFGTICKIVLLPSRPKEWLCGSSAAIRPSSMCFLVLGDRESASRILSQETYQVGTCTVSVSSYSPENSCFNKTHVRSQSRTSSMSSMETCSSP